MKKKFKFNFLVTNINISLRFKAEQAKDPEFTLVEFARRFGVIDAHGNPQKAVVWRWIQTKDKYQRTPNFTYRCPQCDKSQHDRIFSWLNDGSLD